MRTPRLLLPIVPLLISTSLGLAQATAGPFDRLRFRSIGPATMSGRIDDVAVLERDPRIFYIAAATGGVWKTTNGGTTVRPVFDSAGSASVGAVAISQRDPNLVWVGTGENNNRQSSSWGDGVYKSTDGGKSWSNMGLRASKQVARILVDPNDADVVYVAALGDLWKTGGDRGIFKTTDGGVTWSKVLDGGPDAGGTELVMDPSNSKVLYAAIYQRRRASWGMNGGGPASGIYKTADGGRTWKRLTNGIPAGSLGRIGLDVFRPNPSIVYARVEHEREGGVYRSDDAGSTWRKMGSTNMRPMYFGIIRVDPSNDLRVYLPAAPFMISDDGGRTFRSSGARIHVDYHAMWINPANPDHLIVGNDGGVGISYDRAVTWLWLPNLPVGQFYHVGFDMQEPYNLCGGLQDNNTWCGPSRVRSSDGIGNDEWFVVEGGDGFVGLIDPTNHRIIYAESQDGNPTRIDRLTNERQGIRPEAPASEKAYRWNWDTPMMLSPHDPATIYIGANRLLKSTDRGMSWTPVSPDLTTAVDRDSLELMGIKGKDLKIAANDGVGSYATLFTIAESKLRAGILYVGSDDGQVNVSRDGGASWANVTSKIPDAPKWAYVSKVEPSKFAEGTVYVTFDAHRTGDYRSYVYRSTDYGASWRSISANLPAGEVARSLTEDVKLATVLYLATETGVFVTTDAGASWVRLRANLPTVPVYEITLHPRDNAMILATHGRALWILDDLNPIQQYAAARAADQALLIEPARLIYRSPADDRMRAFEGDMKFLGENPPEGAPVTYFLPRKADSVRLVIRDASNKGVRTLTGEATRQQAAAGMNTVIWDLRTEPLKRAARGAEGEARGPIVMPGSYRVVLFVNGSEVGTKALAVSGDPAIEITDADRRTRQQLLEELQRLQATVADAEAAVRAADQQLTAVKRDLSDTVRVPAAMRSAIDSAVAMLAPVKRSLGIQDPGQPFVFDPDVFRTRMSFKISGASGNIGGAMAPPTRTDLARVEEVRRDMPAFIEQVNGALERLRGLYRRLSAAGLYPLVPEPVRQR